MDGDPKNTRFRSIARSLFHVEQTRRFILEGICFNSGKSQSIYVAANWRASAMEKILRMFVTVSAGSISI